MGLIATALEEPALLASFISALVASVGIAVAGVNTAWALRQRNSVIALASGILVGTAVTHLLPEALGVTQAGALYVLTGYAAFYALDYAISRGPNEDGGANPWILAAPLIGIAAHSFVDGLEYPVLFKHGLFTGVMAVSGLIAHEFAEGVIVFAIMRGAGVKSAVAAASALFLAALTTPLGAYTALFFTRSLDEGTLAILMAMTAGALLFVGATHLPRQIEGARRGGELFYFSVGITVAAVFSMSHGVENGHIH